MLRLALVFLVWIASTTQVLDEAELRHLTETNVRTIVPDHGGRDRHIAQHPPDER